MPKNTRQNLINAAAKLFADVGYEATSVGDLEKAAGLTPRAGGFYRHFKSKEDILLILAETRLETPERLGLDSIFNLEDTRAELVYIAQAYERLNESGGPLAQIIQAEAGRIPLLSAKMAEANEKLFNGLLEWLKDKPATQQLPMTSIAELVYIVFGGWLFYLGKQGQLLGPVNPKPKSLMLTWATHWANFLDGRP